MPDQTTVLSLPLIMASQAQKHVTHNEALSILDVAVQLAVTNRTRTTVPASPDVGDRYIVANGATGAWAGRDQQIAVYTGDGWEYVTPLAGWRAHVLAEGQTAAFNGAVWEVPGAGPLAPSTLGVNTTADTVNRLAVSSQATLFTHEGAGHQIKVNKAAAADTASLLFQTGFSGRAEMGISGSDTFAIKVSADGTAFAEAFRAEGPGGHVSLPAGVLASGFTLRDGADPAKAAAFSLSGITTGTTRSYTLPNSSGELALLAGTQTFTGTKSFAAKVTFPAPVTGAASITLPHGTAPATPADGDLWTTTAGVFARVNGATVDLSAGGGGANLSYTAATRVLASDTGTDVTLPLATGTDAGLMASADKTKLDGVAAGATVNAADAALRDRATHTGTQGAATIAFGATARILGRNTAGAGAGEELAAAQVRSLINVADGATVNATDAALRDRATHTGTQAQSTIVNLTADLAAKQPLDADLTALAALTGTNTIYYRSAADTWSPVSIGANLTFTAGTLAAAGGGATNLGYTAATRLLTSDTGADVTLPLATGTDAGLMASADKTKLDGVATGATANATDAALRDRATHTGTQGPATIAFGSTARILGRATAGAGAGEELAAAQVRSLINVADGATANAADAALRDRATHTGTQAQSTIVLAGDLAALEALTGTNTIYYRSGADTWSPVTIGANLTFTGGTLAAAGGGGGVADGDKGDVVVSSGGTVWTVESAAGAFTVTGNLTMSGTVFSAPAALGQLAGMGLNAVPTAGNRLHVASAVTTLTHDGAGHQIRVNKAGVAETASLTFQSGLSSRAEIGLIGSNDFSFRVSPDGTAFNDVLTATPATGEMTLPKPLILTPQGADPASPANGTIWTRSTGVFARVNGATVQLDGAGGGGLTVNDLPGPNRFRAFNDFLTLNNDAHLAQTNTGTGAGHTTVTGPDGIGWIRGNLGTTATGRVAWMPILPGTAVAMRFGLGQALFAARLRLVALSDATNTYTGQIGFFDSASTTQTDAAYFRYTHGTNGGRWEAVTRSNSAETAVDTGVAAAINTTWKFEIEVNAAGTQAVFRINGATVATITTNIPVGAGRETQYGVCFNRSTGTAALNSHDMDYILAEQVFASR